MVSIALSLKSLVNSFPGLDSALEEALWLAQGGGSSLSTFWIFVCKCLTPEHHSHLGDVGQGIGCFFKEQFTFFTLCCRSCEFTSIVCVQERKKTVMRAV